MFAVVESFWNTKPQPRGVTEGTGEELQKDPDNPAEIKIPIGESVQSRRPGSFENCDTLLHPAKVINSRRINSTAARRLLRRPLGSPHKPSQRRHRKPSQRHHRAPLPRVLPGRPCQAPPPVPSPRRLRLHHLRLLATRALKHRAHRHTRAPLTTAAASSRPRPPSAAPQRARCA